MFQVTRRWEKEKPGEQSLVQGALHPYIYQSSNGKAGYFFVFKTIIVIYSAISHSFIPSPQQFSKINIISLQNGS